MKEWSKAAIYKLTGGIPSLPKRDLIKENCKKLDIKDEKEVGDLKTIIQLFKDHADGKEVVIPKKEDDKKDDKPEDENAENDTDKDAEKTNDVDKEKTSTPADESIKKERLKGALNIDIFMMIGDIKLCNKERTGEDNKHCCNTVMVERKPVEFLELKQ